MTEYVTLWNNICLYNFKNIKMKRLLTIAAVVLMASFHSMAQPAQSTDVEEGIFKINFLPLSVSYEMKIATLQTIMLEPGFGFGYSIVDSYGYFNFSPYLNFHYRYYYNFEKRNAKGKRTARNSVNFVGAVGNYTAYTNYSNYGENNKGYRYMTMGPVWGIQRNYPKNFSLGIILGPALSFYTTGVRPDIIGSLTLGFHLNSKKDRQ